MTNRQRVRGRLARSWVRLYTLGLPPAVTRERLDEIESDLWEQAQEGQTLRAIVRLLRGAPWDLGWRREQRRLLGKVPRR